MEPLINIFQKEIEGIVDKYKDEGLTYGEAIGVLEIVKLDLWEDLRPFEDELMPGLEE